MKTQSIAHCEYLRQQCKQRFDRVRLSWLECGRWALPHRTRWLDGTTEGMQNNQHIVDGTHLLSLRSYVAGFLEGNTSASRPWFRIAHADPDINNAPENRAWLDLFTRRCLNYLSTSNFYYSAGGFYYDFGVFNTGAQYFDELPGGGLYFHDLTPGSYYGLNNNQGVMDVLVREFSLNVKSLVETYGVKDKKGRPTFNNFSRRVKDLYDQSMYSQKINVVHVIMPNVLFDPSSTVAGSNRQWISLTYEVGGERGQANEGAFDFGYDGIDPMDGSDRFLKISYSKRKPFVVGRSQSSDNFEYGETGPTLQALGAIKSLNKKAISKDQALEAMIRPALQGPASLRKSYVTNAPNSFVPLDAQSMQQGGLKAVNQINPRIGDLVNDVEDLRRMVQKFYFADYLMYLSQNPKTRTATETNAVIQEQQLVIGPNLQALNWTYNQPIVDFIQDYVLFEDPYLPDPPPGLQGQFLRTEFISVFAQAQKAADLPSLNQFLQLGESIAQFWPEARDKINTDKIMDIVADRLFLPAGVNRGQNEVEKMRQQAQAMQQRQQMLEQTLPALAGAAKDAGIQAKQPKQ